MFRAIPLAALFLLFLLGFSRLPAEDKKDEPKADPGAPLQVTLGGKAKYTLDRGGLSAAEYQKKLEEAAKAGKPLPTPAVELGVTITTTADKDVLVDVIGDSVVLTLTLKGKGAVNLDPAITFTKEVRPPQAVRILSGSNAKTPAGLFHIVPIESLSSGFRGQARVSYWTEPGEYELVATLKTGWDYAINSVGGGTSGNPPVTVTSPPLKITVAEKK